MKTKLLFFFGCLHVVFAFAQLNTYEHKMELLGIEDQWHKIELPDTVFEKVSQNMNDLRIYGITENDTLESPYLMKVGFGDFYSKAIDFKVLNKTSNAKGYYFTYEVPTKEAINLIRLDFENKNFDWKVVLEGSQNQNEWFTILNDHRILSIQNEQTNYKYSYLNFPDAKFRYYRILVKTQEKPKLSTTRIIVDVKSKDKFREDAVANVNVNDKNKQTILNLDLKKRLPVSYLKIDVSDEIDFYRNFTIEYLADSVQTEKGWRYSYREIYYGTLNSIEKNEFTFPTSIAQKFRVTIDNNDNQPLTIKSASAKAYVHELHARFSKPATYYLAYGKTSDRKPQYDISHAAAKIPVVLSSLSLGEVQNIPKKEIQTTAPLFENKLWLWLVMGLIILVLGGFTFKMMQKK
ncbi:DUF3999 family protein [Maribacter algarum]|nr:DUF3999 family protein [Maribacter algarum]